MDVVIVFFKNASSPSSDAVVGEPIFRVPSPLPEAVESILDTIFIFLTLKLKDAVLFNVLWTKPFPAVSEIFVQGTTPTPVSFWSLPDVPTFLKKITTPLLITRRMFFSSSLKLSSGFTELVFSLTSIRNVVALLRDVGRTFINAFRSTVLTITPDVLTGTRTDVFRGIHFYFFDPVFWISI